MHRINPIILVWSLVFLASLAFAKKVEVQDPPLETQKVEPAPSENDKGPALKYFQRKPANTDSRAHFMAVHIGGFISSESYKWGVLDKSEDNGKLTMGVTYRMGEWTETMDLLMRVDFNTYELVDGKALKMSILPMVVFPEANSKFPLYFGVGIGPGVFFKQVTLESALALDYQLIAGARLFDVLENTGFSFEMGVKNHLHLLSDGQFNGVFAAAGAVFTF